MKVIGSSMRIFKKAINFLYDYSHATIPYEIRVKRLDNGYLIDNVFVKDLEDVSGCIVSIIKNPHKELPAIEYIKDKTQ